MTQIMRRYCYWNRKGHWRDGIFLRSLSLACVFRLLIFIIVVVVVVRNLTERLSQSVSRLAVELVCRRTRYHPSLAIRRLQPTELFRLLHAQWFGTWWRPSHHSFRWCSAESPRSGRVRRSRLFARRTSGIEQLSIGTRHPPLTF